MSEAEKKRKKEKVVSAESRASMWRRRGRRRKETRDRWEKVGMNYYFILTAINIHNSRKKRQKLHTRTKSVASLNKIKRECARNQIDAKVNSEGRHDVNI